MPSDIPIIVGVGDIVNRSTTLHDAREPADLIFEAIESAIGDSGLSPITQKHLLKSIDSLSLVRSWTWPYDDLIGLLAERLKLNQRKLKHREISEHGGNQPGRLVDDAARRVATGECGVAVVAGGEALASLNAFAKAKKLPPPGWTPISTTVDSVFSPTSRKLQQGNNQTSLNIGAVWAADNTGGLGGIHGIGAPIQVYPLYENGFRAHRGQSIRDNHHESAELYGKFAKVAEGNRTAWNFGQKAESADGIGTVSKRNRMICFPYPKLMSAFNTVNLAAACIVTSERMAKKLGIPENRWVYALGGAGTRDCNDFWERPNFHHAPCISRSLDAALEITGIDKSSIDVYDFYSCFPIVPKLACQHLGLDITNPQKPITLLGGLTSFGGAGNNYSLHAITHMTRAMRLPEFNFGLVLANGGVATYQHVVILSSKRPDRSYPEGNPLPAVITDMSVPKVMQRIEGEQEAVIETYTVDFDRNNQPVRGHVVGRLGKDGTGERFVANHGDERTLRELGSWTTEPIGRSGRVAPDLKKDGRNVFVLDSDAARL